MRNRRLLSVAAGLAAVALALTCARRGASAPRPAQPSAALIPVVHVKLSKDMAVQMEFENTSKQAIRYFGMKPGEPNVGWALMKDGRRVSGLAGTPPPLFAAGVHELKPGQRLTQTFKLRQWVSDRDLKPGRYLCVAQYGEGSQYGLTPMEIKQTMYVIIEK